MRQRVFDRLRNVLTPSQHQRFDRNILMIEDSDIAMWFVCGKPYTGTSTVGASVP